MHICTLWISLEGGFGERGPEDRKTPEETALVFSAGVDVSLNQSWGRMNEEKRKMEMETLWR